MNPSERIARNVREFHFGPNPTFLDLRETLADVRWHEATERLGSLHTIAELTYHIHFFVRVGLKVLAGEPLDSGDSEEHSFDVPPVESEEAWQSLLESVWSVAEAFASAVEELPVGRLGETFLDGRYGDHHRNLHGTVEHGYYHLGQIVLVKKLLAGREEGPQASNAP